MADNLQQVWLCYSASADNVLNENSVIMVVVDAREQCSYRLGAGRKTV